MDEATVAEAGLDEATWDEVVFGRGDLNEVIVAKATMEEVTLDEVNWDKVTHSERERIYSLVEILRVIKEKRSNLNGVQAM